jgi:hypothetical protein
MVLLDYYTINQILSMFQNITHGMPICWFQANQHFFIKTILSNPSSFDVPIFNSHNISHNLSFKFPPGTLILGNLIYMKHKQPSTLH